MPDSQIEIVHELSVRADSLLAQDVLKILRRRFVAGRKGKAIVCGAGETAGGRIHVTAMQALARAVGAVALLALLHASEAFHYGNLPATRAASASGERFGGARSEA
jgi:hypothetical protein